MIENSNITISLEEMKKIELSILKKIDAICRKENLRYSLMDGSLIGAVRHSGFIPWDDDIDIMMPRPDYEKLKEYFEKNEVEGIKYLSCEIQEDYYYPFAKVIDTSTILKEGKQYEIKGYGIFVDIFPIDGIEKNAIKRFFQMNKIKFLRPCLEMSFHSEVDSNSKIKFVLKSIFTKFVKIFGFKKIVNYINKSCKKISYNDADYTTILYSTISTKAKKYYEKNFFEEYIECDFEGEKIKILKYYDSYLTDLFGDYMELPPEESRKSNHNIELLTRK